MELKSLSEYNDYAVGAVRSGRPINPSLMSDCLIHDGVVVTEQGDSIMVKTSDCSRNLSWEFEEVRGGACGGVEDSDRDSDGDSDD